MELNAWTAKLRSLYDKALDLYRQGHRDAESYFTPEETSALAAIGLRPINLFDYAEDFINSNEPDWDTVLLIVAARRDYFLYKQERQWSAAIIDSSELPAKDASLGGIPWLQRIVRKAKCFLDGGLCLDIMYCCGGDRRFLKQHGIHPADFLRAVWATDGDEAKMLDFVKKASGSL